MKILLKTRVINFGVVSTPPCRLNCDCVKIKENINRSHLCSNCADLNVLWVPVMLWPIICFCLRFCLVFVDAKRQALVSMRPLVVHPTLYHRMSLHSLSNVCYCIMVPVG